MSKPPKTVDKPIEDFGKSETQEVAGEKPNEVKPTSSYSSSFEELFKIGIKIYSPKIQEVLKSIGFEDRYFYTEESMRMLYPIIQISPEKISIDNYGGITGMPRQVIKARTDIPENILSQMLGFSDTDEKNISEMSKEQMEEFLNEIAPFSKKSYTLTENNVKTGMRTMGLGIEPKFRPLLAATIELMEQKDSVAEEIIGRSNRSEVLEYFIPLPFLTEATKKYNQPLNEIPLVVKSFSDLIKEYKTKWSIS